MNPQDYQNQLFMNRAIVDGMRAEAAQNPINTAVNNIVPNFTPADMVKLLQGYKAQQDLYEQKKAYEAAAQGDAGNAQRVASAAAGQSIRNQLNKLGVDTSNADKLNAAGYAPIVEGAKRDLLSQIYSMPSSDEVYSSLYESKLRQGMGKRKAMEQAVAETEPYAAKLDRMTKIAMGQLGTENGVVNNNGFTSALLSANPNEALLRYASFYATPKDQWQVDQKIRQLRTAGDIASNQSTQNYAQQLGLIDKRGQWGQSNMRLESDLGAEQDARRFAYSQQAADNELARTIKGREAEFITTYNSLKGLFGEDMAKELALASIMNTGKGDNNKAGKPLTASEEKLVGELQLNSKKLLQGDIDIREFEDFVDKNSVKLSKDQNIMQEIYNLKTLNEWWQNYNYGGKHGAGKTFENTIKQAKVILEDRNKDIQELAKKYGLWDYLKQYEKKDVNAPQNARLEK